MPFPYTFPIIFGELPGVQVLLGGEILTIRRGSILVGTKIEERGTAGFEVVDADGSLSFARGTPLTIWDTEDTLIFGGFVSKPSTRHIAPSGGIYHKIACIDYHYLADKRLVVASYSSTAAGTIVTALHTNYLDDEGVTIGAIQTGPVIDEAVFNYVSVAEALDAMAELSGFTWFIDEQKRLFFVDRTTYTAPWNWSTSTYKPAGSVATLSSGNPLYRNQQYIRGGTGLTAEQTEVFTGDAQQVAFTVGYPIAQVPTVTVADRAPEAQTVGIKGLSSGKDCYWSKGDSAITFDIAPENAKAVTIVYYGQYPLISLATDEGERVARQAIEGGTGRVENIADEAHHETNDSSTASAKAKIADFGRDAQKFIYRTTTSGIKPGQLQTINYPLLGLDNTEMLIEAVLMRPDGQQASYEVTAVVGPVMGSWAKFFTNMMRQQKASIRIGDSELIVLLQELEDLALAETTNIYDDDFTGGLVNRWLNAAPIDTGSIGNVEHEALALSEVPSLASATTEDYYWDDGTLWDFGTWA